MATSTSKGWSGKERRLRPGQQFRRQSAHAAPAETALQSVWFEQNKLQSPTEAVELKDLAAQKAKARGGAKREAAQAASRILAAATWRLTKASAEAQSDGRLAKGPWHRRQTRSRRLHKKPAEQGGGQESGQNRRAADERAEELRRYQFNLENTLNSQGQTQQPGGIQPQGQAGGMPGSGMGGGWRDGWRLFRRPSGRNEWPPRWSHARR